MPSNKPIKTIPSQLITRINQQLEQNQLLLDEVRQYCPEAPDTRLDKSIQFIRICLSPGKTRQIECLKQYIETNAPFLIDLTTNVLKLAGEKYRHLNPAPVRLLANMIMHHGDYFTYKEMADWGCLQNRNHRNFGIFEKYTNQIKTFCISHFNLLGYAAQRGILTCQEGNDKNQFYWDNKTGMARSTTSNIRIYLKSEVVIIITRNDLDWAGIRPKEFRNFRKKYD